MFKINEFVNKNIWNNKKIIFGGFILGAREGEKFDIAV